MPAINGWFTPPGAISCRFAPPDWPRMSAKLFGLITLETRFVELEVSYGAFMRVGILFGVRTQSSDPEVASELTLCPTMTIPGCILSGSIPSLSAAAGFILGGAVRLLFVLARLTLWLVQGQSKSHVYKVGSQYAKQGICLGQ